ncbi:putative serine/threonine-protein kinase-like protein CCR3 [Impatiens glandulifera]|uniref:putative serine/threonine-protein kinase-like protein CCR3 n=1 Tax=Impatiens glandulifera TaxID=253017 RepID=UPI001FB07675|nr:putative serine/threonine-protein kinase-like protein CCR3 [Impatiens glandulifera]
MTTTAIAAAIIVLIGGFFFFFLPSQVNALGGTAPTIAVIFGENVSVCGVTTGPQSRGGIKCWRGGRVFDVFPGVSFDYIAGGRDVFCGIVSGGFSLLCFNSTFGPKRIYRNPSVLLQDLTIGDGQICALTNETRNARCWRGTGIPPTFTSESDGFLSLSSGLGFSCGVLMKSKRVVCMGRDKGLASSIENEFLNYSMLNIKAGGNFACGLNVTGFIVCGGRNESRQLNIPLHNSAVQYSSLALGNSHGCAIRNSNGSVVCWGNLENGEDPPPPPPNISFESIVAGFNFTCGLVTSNLSVICWGPGWPNLIHPAGIALPLPQILPGPCIQSNCSECGIYPQSQLLCHGYGNICKTCNLQIPLSPPAAAPPNSNPGGNPVPRWAPSKRLKIAMLIFAIVGSIGLASGFCALLYCLWTGACCGRKKIHNSVQPTIAGSNSKNGRTSNKLFSRSPPTTLLRQGSRIMRRQRSGPSSKHPDRAEEFSFRDLAAATDNFSPENRIGAGSFGVVYRGKLWDGREVAIKRGGETEEKAKKFQEKESAFESELAFLSRLHHKHLVGLVGYCDERDEMLLVYDYMKNRALYDHLHDKSNVEKDSSVLNTWKIRIKISLDAARGIEYLHDYAVPPIIHRDIKSSNILLDSNWTARVSDLGLSLLDPETEERECFPPAKAAGTIGYIDPEYYSLNLLTAKSDVYGLGVVMLELLTGKRAIFKKEGGEEYQPISLVDFAAPAIRSGDLWKIMDKRVGAPEGGNEAEAVELMAHIAAKCVSLEGKDRPTMGDIVANMERALGMLDDTSSSHGSISSGPLSMASDHHHYYL